MGGVPRRGDSGGRVSQPISDTGEPLLTYGVASRMYFTGIKKKKKKSLMSFEVEVYFHCNFIQP